MSRHTTIKGERKRIIFVGAIGVYMALWVLYSMAIAGRFRFDETGNLIVDWENDYSAATSTGGEELFDNTETEEGEEYEVFDKAEEDVDGGIKSSNATQINRKVAIVTKVLGPLEVDKIGRMLCLLSHSYNDKKRHDIVIFTTLEWDDDTIEKLRKVVTPTKLTVALEGPPLKERMAKMNQTELEYLLKRCNASKETLSWYSHCTEEGFGGISNLGYAWQAEFRSYHIWTHDALKEYRYMMWFDTDALVTREWDLDPMEVMVKNNLVVSFAAFPYGKSSNQILKDKMMKHYNQSICTVRQTPEGTLYRRKCEGNMEPRIAHIGGFHHITDLDVYRRPIHQRFLKDYVGDHQFSREFDDQGAVTIVAVMEQELFGIPFVPTLWLQQKHNMSLKISHHGRLDNKGEKSPRRSSQVFVKAKDGWKGLEQRCGFLF